MDQLALVSIMSSLCQTGDAYPEGLCKFNRNILSLQAAWGIKFVFSVSRSCGQRVLPGLQFVCQRYPLSLYCQKSKSAQKEHNENGVFFTELL